MCHRNETNDLSSLQWPPDIEYNGNHESKRCVCNMRNIRWKQKKGTLNLTLISLTLIVYIISCRSLVFLFSAGVSTGASDQLRNFDLPIIGWVAADPAPEASPVNALTATSRSYRAPPINGSMFGKRSVNIQSSTRAHYASGSSQLESQNQQREATTTIKVPQDDVSTSHKDTITDIIEDFLVQNNESKYKIMQIFG